MVYKYTVREHGIFIRFVYEERTSNGNILLSVSARNFTPANQRQRPRRRTETTTTKNSIHLGRLARRIWWL